MEKNHPGIVRYGHHHRAIYYCQELAELEAVERSIKATVVKAEPKSPEIPLLKEAYLARQADLRELARQEKDKKEKVVLISREKATDENVRKYGK